MFFLFGFVVLRSFVRNSVRIGELQQAVSQWSNEVATIRNSQFHVAEEFAFGFGFLYVGCLGPWRRGWLRVSMKLHHFDVVGQDLEQWVAGLLPG